MHFDVVLSEFIHSCSKKRRRAQFSISAELTRLSVCARFRCVCAHASDVCVRALQMCVCVRFRWVCVRARASDVCVRTLQMCVCARFRCVCAHSSDVCVRTLQMCVCVRALQMCARIISHTVRDCAANNPERLICSSCAFRQSYSLYRVLIREIEGECTRWG